MRVGRILICVYNTNKDSLLLVRPQGGKPARTCRICDRDDAVTLSSLVNFKEHNLEMNDSLHDTAVSRTVKP